MIQFFKKRAAKKYALKLGPRLATAYGSSKIYTQMQIKAAVEKLRLPKKYICFGYAAFLSPDDYQKHFKSLPIKLSRDEALALYQHYSPTDLYSANANSETTISPVIAGMSGD